jgi:hypothetical protein
MEVDGHKSRSKSPNLLPAKREDIPPNKTQCEKFINNTKIALFGGGSGYGKDETYQYQNGFLFCRCCNTEIMWNTRFKHAKSDSGNELRKDGEKLVPIVQQRILKEDLVGKIYNTSCIFATMNWLRALFAGNVALNAITSMQVRCTCSCANSC